MDVTPLVHPSEEVVEAIWKAAQMMCDQIPDKSVGNLACHLARVFKRRVHYGGWSMDKVRGTQAPLANDFTQAVTSDSLTRPEQVNEFARQLKACLSGNLDNNLGVVIHGGLYPACDPGSPKPWDELSYEDFAVYVEAAKKGGWLVTIDPTLFNHYLAKHGLDLATISSLDEKKRRFFVEHVKRVIEIAQRIADELGYQVVVNIWAIDGRQTKAVNRLKRRQAMRKSLQEIGEYAKAFKGVQLAVEYKRWAAETTQFTVGSPESLAMFVAQHLDMFCLTQDMGHEVPGMDWSDRISACEMNGVKIVTHASQGWFGDDDLTVTPTDQLIEYFRELKMCGLEESPVIIDTFDKVTNAFAATVISVLSVRVAQFLAEIYYALTEALEEAEDQGNNGAIMMISEASRLLTPSMIVAKAALMFGLEDPAPLIEAMWQPA